MSAIDSERERERKGGGIKQYSFTLLNYVGNFV